jgi:hypothetical protein
VGFAPPPPFTLDELNPAGIVPSPAYTRETLLDYLAHCLQKWNDSQSKAVRTLPRDFEGTLTFSPAADPGS